MSSDNTEATPGEVGTPEGFAETKAALLNLTPLEVLKCLEKLCQHDQDKVVRVMQRNREAPKEIAEIQVKVDALRLQVEQIIKDRGKELKSLETHTPATDYVSEGTWTSRIPTGKQHVADAFKYAPYPQGVINGPVTAREIMIKQEEAQRRMEMIKLQYDQELLKSLMEREDETRSKT